MPNQLRRHRRFSLGVAGVAAMELAMIAPAFSTLLIMFVDVGKAYHQQVQIDSAVSNGAEFAYLGAQNGTAVATIMSELPTEVVAASSSLLSASNVSIYINNNQVTASTTSSQMSTWWGQKCCLSGGAGSAVSWSCSSTTTSCADTSNPGVYVTVSASLPFTPYFPLDAKMTGKTLVSSITARVQ
jgi:Flp pilus assembly protein TadG